jgi:hypothetical protein
VKLSKNAPAYRQAGICGVIRPPYRLGAAARSRSLFVATSFLTLSHVKLKQAFAT